MVVAILLTKRGTTTLEPTGSASADPPPFAKGKYLLYNKSSFSGRSADGSAQRSGR